MITPVFGVEQNPNFLIITLRAPYTNIKDTEIVYEDRTFLFASKPYFLRLFLPASVVDDETGTADYDMDTGSKNILDLKFLGNFIIKVPKLNKNEHFENLEMLSELLKVPNNEENSINAKVLVEEVNQNLQENNINDGNSIKYIFIIKTTFRRTLC